MLAYGVFQIVGNLSITLLVDILLKIISSDIGEVVVVVFLDTSDNVGAEGTVGPSSLNSKDAENEEDSKNFRVHGEPLRVKVSVIVRVYKGTGCR